MKKILVPMDFSIAASWGFYYAYDLAAAIHAEIIVLHVYLPDEESLYSMEEDDFVHKKKEKLLKHLKEATQHPLSHKFEAVHIDHHIGYGRKGQIADYAKDFGVDLIVMGTHGQGKSVDKVFGSNTSQVINKAHCPVLAIPQGATFKIMQHIAYATNFDEKDKDILTELMPLVNATKSKLHCVHVNLIDQDFSEENVALFEQNIKAHFQHQPITFSTWSAETVEEGLSVFCRINKIQMVSILTRNASIWEKIFGRKSTTKQLIQEKRLPILIFRK